MGSEDEEGSESGEELGQSCLLRNLPPNHAFCLQGPSLRTSLRTEVIRLDDACGSNVSTDCDQTDGVFQYGLSEST